MSYLVCVTLPDAARSSPCPIPAVSKTNYSWSVRLTDRVSAASVKAGAAGASRATARGAVGVTDKLVGCIR